LPANIAFDALAQPLRLPVTAVAFRVHDRGDAALKASWNAGTGHKLDNKICVPYRMPNYEIQVQVDGDPKKRF